METSQAIQPLALRMSDFTRVTGLSRSKAYELIKNGELRAVKVGGRRLIPYSEAERLIRDAA